MIHSKREGIKPLDFDTPTFGRGFWLKPIDLSRDSKLCPTFDLNEQ